MDLKKDKLHSIRLSFIDFIASEIVREQRLYPQQKIILLIGNQNGSIKIYMCLDIDDPIFRPQDLRLPPSYSLGREELSPAETTEWLG